MCVFCGFFGGTLIEEIQIHATDPSFVYDVD